MLLHLYVIARLVLNEMKELDEAIPGKGRDYFLRFIMMRLGKGRLRFLREQRGLTLIETLVGVAIFAAIGVPLMVGLSTGYKSLDISRERTFAESLAKSQVEYIKEQQYISVANYAAAGPYDVIDISPDLTGAGYTVEISPPVLVEVAGVSGHELQSITIKVKRHDEGKLIITFYRVGLAL